MNSKKFLLGGDIQKSLTEGYHFKFKQLFMAAFNITREHFVSLFTACIFIVFILTALFTLFFDESTSFDNPEVMVGGFILALLIAPPILTGLLMMGIHHSIGLKTQPLHIFKYFNIMLKLSLAAMVIHLMTNAGSFIFDKLFGDGGVILSALILLYIKMSFCLVYPLIAEKQVPPLEALNLSFRLVHKNVLQFTFLFILFGLLFLLGLLTSGLGFLIIIPFCINVMGIVYRQICGVHISITDTSNNNESDNPPSTGSGGFEA